MGQEIWKDIEGYEGKYQVSNCGNVRSLMYHNAKGIKRISLLKPATDACGYFRCALSKNNILTTYKVHRLVAQAFIPNPNNYPQINHIDGNKKNNCVWNLEWCTDKENVNHALKTGLRKNEKVKIVETGEIFENAYECAKAINGNAQDIYRCLYGKTKTHKKYHYEVVV